MIIFACHVEIGVFDYLVFSRSKARRNSITAVLSNGKKKGHGLIIVLLTIRPTQPYLASLVNGKNAVSIFSKIVYTQNPPRLEKYVHFTSIRGYLTDRPLTTRTLNSILANAESCMRSPGLQRLVCMYMYVRTFRGFILSALCASLFQNPLLYSTTLKQIFPIFFRTLWANACRYIGKLFHRLSV